MTQLINPQFDLAQPRHDPVLRELTLEISAKPFLDHGDANIRRVFADIFRHWYSLAKHARRVTVLWWFSDGTDLLEYHGDLSRPIEWAKWLGFAAKTYDVSVADDPRRESLVGTPHIYHPDAPVFTYADVKRVVQGIRAAGREILGRSVEVGIAFDPGTEFGVSPFRYKGHPELLLGKAMRCIDCTGLMKADPGTFSGFPNGVPEGTPFGTFMGRQAKHYLKDMGFDMLWLSNGFGFGRAPYAWGGVGQFFDGCEFTPAGNQAVHDGVLDFWRRFRAECPEGRIACRGSDFSVGMNLVNHASPIQGIFTGGFAILPPPNTPWPYLTRNHGLALAGYLSTLSAWRGEGHPYRFYASDPWWCTQPWSDRYERSPHDIVLSTAVTVIDEHGGIRAFDSVNILSLDSAWGEIPEELPDEIIPALKRVLRQRPDAVPPVVWLYPFEQYHSWIFTQPEKALSIYAGDLAIQAALGSALPLTGVATVEAWLKARNLPARPFSGRILVSPVPDAGSPWEESLLDHVRTGGQVLLYGSCARASDQVRQVLGLQLDEPLSGRFTARTTQVLDTALVGPMADGWNHLPSISDGGMCESASATDTGVLAWARQADDRQRVMAVVRNHGAGLITWVRGCIASTVERLKGRNLETLHPAEAFPGEILMRHALAALGMRISVHRGILAPRQANLMISRSYNAFIFGIHGADPELEIGWRLPLGIPILPGRATTVKAGEGRIRANGCIHEPCRIFVEQEAGRLELHSISPKHARYRRRWQLHGLANAVVRFFPETGCEARTDILLDCNENHFVQGKPLDIQRVESPHGTYLEMRGVTGNLVFAWGHDDAVLPVIPPGPPEDHRV